MSNLSTVSALGRPPLAELRSELVMELEVSGMAKVEAEQVSLVALTTIRRDRRDFQPHRPSERRCR